MRQGWNDRNEQKHKRRDGNHRNYELNSSTRNKRNELKNYQNSGELEEKRRNRTFN